jgi:hypothetical protein
MRNVWIHVVKWDVDKALNVSLKIIVVIANVLQELREIHSHHVSADFAITMKIVPITNNAIDWIASVVQLAMITHAEPMPFVKLKDIKPRVNVFQEWLETLNSNVMLRRLFHDLNVPLTLNVHHNLLVSVNDAKIHVFTAIFVQKNKLVQFSIHFLWEHSFVNVHQILSQMSTEIALTLQETSQLVRVISIVLIMINVSMDSVCWHVTAIRVVSMHCVLVHLDIMEILILNVHLKEINQLPSVTSMTIVHLIVLVIKENVWIHVRFETRVVLTLSVMLKIIVQFVDAHQVTQEILKHVAQLANNRKLNVDRIPNVQVPCHV